MLTARTDSVSILITLNNISTPGTYQFGHIDGLKAIFAGCSIANHNYSNNYEELSGSLTLDSLTKTRIKGTFNIKCFEGTESLEIKNGNFAGKFLY
ncbi:MAG: hypothetical protein HYX40_03560 [Sphingobacteriales bacterium]|nr:hypothetical protein [Sphingobacteriales bacterium]